MEAVEKKVYPSQLNTKALACRVPIADYVKFLNEAVGKGITINDWLLMKIYTNEGDKISGIEEEEIIEEFEGKFIITKDELLLNEDYHNALVFWFKRTEFFKGDKIEVTREILIELLCSYASRYMENYAFWNTKKEASLSDVKNQLTVLIKNKFPDYSEQKEYRKELFEWLKELE